MRVRRDQLTNTASMQRYGQVRPEIAMEFKGYKFIAIGGKLIYMPAERCKFFTDVLIAYVPQLFGREWFEQEIAEGSCRAASRNAMAD